MASSACTPARIMPSLASPKDDEAYYAVECICVRAAQKIQPRGAVPARQRQHLYEPSQDCVRPIELNSRIVMLTHVKYRGMRLRAGFCMLCSIHGYRQTRFL